MNQSEAKCVFTVSFQDALLASIFSLADFICQVLVTISRSVFFISFEYKLTDIHLGSSSPPLSNNKELSLASDTPFSNELC